MGPIWFVAAAAAVISACFSPYSFEDAAKEDTLEAYRQFLEENPNDINQSVAHRRMAEIEFNEAVKAGTVWGFKKFLQEYPDSIQVEAARKYLEELRFAKAQKENTKQAYLTFLSFHPDGDSARKARSSIMEIEYAAVRKGDPQALRRYIAFYPDSPFRADAEAKLDDIEFDAARKEGEAGLLEYLARRKGGPHEVEARMLYARAALDRSMARCRVKRAAALLAEFGRDPKLGGIRAEYGPRVAEATGACAARKALLSLDSAALFRLSKSTGRYAGAAAAALKLASGRPAAFGDLKALTTSALAHGEAGTLKGLRALSDSRDPVERHRAAVMLRFLPKGGALDAALNLLGDQYVPVRHAAAGTISAIAGLLSPAQVERTFGSRISRIEEQARDAALYFKAAVLYEARGLKSEALSLFRKAALADRYDPYVIFRLALAESSAGEPMKAIAAYGQFVKVASAAMKEREGIWDEKPPPAVSDSTRAIAFQYCGLLELLKNAEAILGPAALSAGDIGKEERLALESAGGRVARGAEFMDKAAAVMGEGKTALCGGDGGAAAVVNARTRRTEAVRALVEARPPWLAALLEEIVAFESDADIRKLAERSLSVPPKPVGEGEKR
ncbi:MAG: hypothetical protein HY897_13590 [Deltaproteobacteria bacterium]|nr:hypothetical protein [Deltaproteobacteria bacterium]